jgi:hypothetical protein
MSSSSGKNALVTAHLLNLQFLKCIHLGTIVFLTGSDQNGELINEPTISLFKSGSLSMLITAT